MKLALTLRGGVVLTGKGEDIRRLLAYTSAFGAGKGAVDVTRRVEGASGATESVMSVRWVNPAEVVHISEVPDG